MNLAELRTAVQIEINRFGGAAPSPLAIDHYLNLAGEDFARESRILRLSTTMDVTANTPDYALPTGALELLRVYFQGRTLGLTSFAELDGTFLVWKNHAGLPLAYLMPDADHVKLYPMPDATSTDKSLQLDTIQTFTPLALDADIPALPVEYHRALIWGAVNSISPNEEAAGRYQQALQGAILSVTRNHSSASRRIPYRDF